jgi:hypothetical protein
MNCGRLWVARIIKSGCGWHWMLTLGSLWAVQLGHAIRPQQRSYGIVCQRNIVNVPCASPTSTKSMPASCRPNDTKRLAKKQAKPLILSVSTTLFANAVLVLCVKPCPSRKNSPIILGRFGILFMITMRVSVLGLDSRRLLARDCLAVGCSLPRG